MNPHTKPVTDWALRPWLRPSTVLLLFVALLIAGWSAQRTEMDHMLVMSAQAIAAGLGSGEPSQVADGFARIGGNLLPLQVSETTELSRLQILTVKTCRGARILKHAASSSGGSTHRPWR